MLFILAAPLDEHGPDGPNIDDICMLSVPGVHGDSQQARRHLNMVSCRAGLGLAAMRPRAIHPHNHNRYLGGQLIVVFCFEIFLVDRVMECGGLELMDGSNLPTHPDISAQTNWK